LATRKIVLVSMPFNIGVGGYRRSYFVLPFLSRELYSEGFEVELYIPANAIRTVLKFLMWETCNRESTYVKKCIEDLLHKIHQTIHDLEKNSHYTLYINEKVLDAILSLNIRFLTMEQNNAKKCSISPYQLVIEKSREFLMPILEIIAWNRIRQYYNYSSIGELIVYSHHETVDALTVTSLLSKYAKGIFLLMQLNIKDLIAKAILHNTKSKLLGVLAVSPQPIIESPFITGIAKNIKILIPALALDPTLYTIDKSKIKKEPYSAIYFGRLSREKGLIDLLRVWSIISQNEPRARLTLIGMPESRDILTIMYRYLAKFKNVRYLGYLPPNKLYQEVAKHHVLIYPSYRDSFALAVLEALALGLKVMAYDIPAIRYMYSRSNMVHIVRKGSISSLAKGTLQWFYIDVEPNTYTKALISLHSSWKDVSQEEAQAILLFYNKMNL